MRHYSAADITAVILAGGMGTRLRSVLGEKQKVMAEVQGRPFLTFLLDRIAAVGLRHAVICTGYQGSQLMSGLGDSYGELAISYSHEAEPLGTAGALRLALPQMDSEDVLVMNGDSLCSVDIHGLLEKHRKNNADATMVLTFMPDAGRYGSVDVDVDAYCRITGFREKDGGLHTSAWINAGIYLMQRRLMETIPEHSFVSLERDMFPQWIEKRFFAYKNDGTFIDIGIPDAYAQAEQFIAGKALSE